MQFVKKLLHNDPKNPEALGPRVKNALREYKVVWVSCEDGGPDNPHDTYTEAARDVGELVPMEENLFTGNKTGDLWTDIKFDPNVKGYFRTSATAQPLHTDGSYESDAPDLTFFYCVTRADYGGATTFLDSTTLLAILEQENRDLLDRLRTTPVWFRKGNDAKERTIISEDDRLNWNWFVTEENESPAKELCQEFKAFMDRVEQCGITTPVPLDKGEAVFFHDELLFHGRDAFFGHRWLKKGGVRFDG